MLLAILRISTFVFLSLISYSKPECVPKENMFCYECESWNNEDCKDPFDWVGLHQPKLVKCNGCCIKLVGHAKTEYAGIRRSCVENMTLAEVGCTSDNSDTGQIMCFCNEDRCNEAFRITASVVILFLGFSFFHL